MIKKILLFIFLKQKKEVGRGGRGKLGFPTNKYDYYTKVSPKMNHLNLQN